MRSTVRRFLTLLFFLLSSLSAHNLLATVQQSKQLLKGRVKNEAKNYFLTSATATLFKADSTLVSFQITDAYGSFSFGNIILDQEYFVQISSMGYAQFSKPFRIEKAGSTLDLGIIHLEESSIAIDEVAIQLSPVRMNGDTLEFDPRGLKMDANAVAEDFLRKIPNITIWNDGQITVNGREISTLLVNGKPFFGGDFKIATQNLPTDVIDKVQVYKKEENKSNSLDSIMEMNIKLKKDAGAGYFGKVSIGKGNLDRIDVEGTLNYYTKRTQTSVALAGNNTNKIAADLETVLSQGTYKSPTNYLDYQSDSRLPGINTTYLGGVRFNYNFIEDPQFNQQSAITADHFYQDRATFEVIDNRTIMPLTDDSQNLESGTNTSDRSVRSNKFNLKYNWIQPDHTLSLRSAIKYQDEEVANLNSRSISDELGQELSNSQGVYNSNTSSQSYLVSLDYNYNPQHYLMKKRPPFSFSYSGTFDDSKNNADLVNTFTSFIDPSSNMIFDRNYHIILQENRQNASVVLPNFERVILGYPTRFLNIDLVANYARFGKKLNSVVSDSDMGVYDINDNLSDQNTEEEQKFHYGTRLNKSWGKRLSERYEKNTRISLGLLFANIGYKNKSLFDFRNIQRQYADFVPEVSISRLNNNFGRFMTSFSSEIKTELNLPYIDQLAPLVDSAQVFFIRRGNLNVDREKVYTSNTSFEYVDLKTKNAFRYKLGVGFDYSNNKIIDSIFITPDNRQQAFAVNGFSYRKFRASVEVRKSVKFAGSDFNFFVGANFDQTATPTYINEVFLKNNSKDLSLTSTLGYGINDVLNIEFRERIFFNELKQEVLNSQFNGTTLSHTLSINYAIDKNLSVNTNLTYNSNRSTWASPVNFTIWNTYVAYRMLRNKTAEIKLSAVDLLRQNRNVSNIFNNGNFTTIYSNNLQQYFMLSLAYYPRRF
ncbi:outer membrane beta-barrel protein [Sphingobacterium chungjuense]|uniref:outer membrane beta-barrel protein n=1 Tax=Sphingobacterium chungjuense TaxID=2675553 RepID=UPI00140DBD0C|nr:outer membrane beta-barrel protein [Sphingobacterium chungjuense]